METRISAPKQGGHPWFGESSFFFETVQILGMPDPLTGKTLGFGSAIFRCDGTTQGPNGPASISGL